MTTRKNRQARRRLAAIAQNAAQPDQHSLELLQARKSWLMRAQRAYQVFKGGKGVGSSTRELILPLASAPPLTVTLCGGKIRVKLTVDEDSELLLGRPHLCRYMGENLPRQPRQAVVLFALRDRQEEINRIMAELRKRQR